MRGKKREDKEQGLSNGEPSEVVQVSSFPSNSRGKREKKNKYKVVGKSEKKDKERPAPYQDVQCGVFSPKDFPAGGKKRLSKGKISGSQ